MHKASDQCRQRNCLHNISLRAVKFKVNKPFGNALNSPVPSFQQRDGLVYIKSNWPSHMRHPGSYSKEGGTVHTCKKIRVPTATKYYHYAFLLYPFYSLDWIVSVANDSDAALSR